MLQRIANVTSWPVLLRSWHAIAGLYPAEHLSHIFEPSFRAAQLELDTTIHTNDNAIY